MARTLKRALAVTDYVVTISELTDYTFTKLEGGRTSTEMVAFSDGTTKTERYSVGKTTWEPITISKPFHAGDEDLLQKLKEYRCMDAGLTVILERAKKCNNELEGKARVVTYHNCLIESFTDPNFDDIGSDISMIEVVLRPDDKTYAGESSFSTFDSSLTDQFEDLYNGNVEFGDILNVDFGL